MKKNVLGMEVIMKKIFVALFAIFMLSSLSGCLGFDENHISQKEATKLAEALTGGEVTYMRTEEVSETKHYYYFTDAKGVTFSIESLLRQQTIDDSKPFGPYYCSVWDNYQKTIFENNKEAILDILEQNGLTEYLDYVNDNAISMKFYVGTPEENRALLEKLAAVGAEIDTLLDITYDQDYDEEIRNTTDYSYSSISNLTFRLSFYKTVESEGMSEMCIDVAHPEFSTSSDQRWTAESLYEAMLQDIDRMEVGE